MLEFTIEIVELQQKETRLIVLYIILWSQVNRYIDLVLYLNNKTEV